MKIFEKPFTIATHIIMMNLLSYHEIYDEIIRNIKLWTEIYFSKLKDVLFRFKNQPKSFQDLFLGNRYDFTSKNFRLKIGSPNNSYILFIITIEDAAELKLNQPHVVALESRPANAEGKGKVSIRDLVINALRMRPDRIVVGECRGGEALDMLQAMNTGHEGSLTTIHANTPRDAVSRLETMITMGGVELPLKALRQQFAAAVNLIIQVNRLQGGPRKVTHVTEVLNLEQDTVIMQDIFLFVQDGIDADGRAYGHFEATGVRPAFMDQLEAAGVRLPSNLFANRVLQ